MSLIPAYCHDAGRDVDIQFNQFTVTIDAGFGGVTNAAPIAVLSQVSASDFFQSGNQACDDDQANAVVDLVQLRLHFKMTKHPN